jgi:hypothetical protein
VAEHSRFSPSDLLGAFDEIGKAAVDAGQRLELLVYGGSALMLAGNFRYSTEDVDIASIGAVWPDWLKATVLTIAEKNNWNEDWMNDAVSFHLSNMATLQSDHFAFGTFPRDGASVGLSVHVPTAEYMLAMKLKAMRVLEPGKGEVEADDIRSLLRVLGISDVESAISVLGKYFPVSAAGAEKQRFLLKNVIFASSATDTVESFPANAPQYPVPSGKKTR